MLSSRTSLRYAGTVLLPALLLPFAASAASPTDATARVPAVQYRSAFEQYHSPREEHLRSWTEANTAVAAGNPASAHQHGSNQPASANAPQGHDHGSPSSKEAPAGKPMEMGRHEMMMRHHEAMKKQGMSHGDMKHDAMGGKPMDHGSMK